MSTITADTHAAGTHGHSVWEHPSRRFDLHALALAGRLDDLNRAAETDLHRRLWAEIETGLEEGRISKDQTQALLDSLNTSTPEQRAQMQADITEAVEALHALYASEDDPYDTESWQDYATDLGIEERDFPPECPEPGEPNVDWAAMHTETVTSWRWRLKMSLAYAVQAHERDLAAATRAA